MTLILAYYIVKICFLDHIYCKKIFTTRDNTYVDSFPTSFSYCPINENSKSRIHNTVAVMTSYLIRATRQVDSHVSSQCVITCQKLEASKINVHTILISFIYKNLNNLINYILFKMINNKNINIKDNNTPS